MITRNCTKCFKILPLEEFYDKPEGKFGKQSRCMTCMRSYQRQQWKNNNIMPRNISFFKTQTQIRNRTKTQTRRMGWKQLKPGTILTAVEKGQGLKKGEKVKRMGLIKVTKIYNEPLSMITREDVIQEGFPDMTVSEFLTFFCKFNKCAKDDYVTVIHFEYLSEIISSQKLISWKDSPQQKMRKNQVLVDAE